MVSVLQDYITFMTSKNFDYKMFTREKMVCMTIRYCLFKIVMLQKIRRNKDASHKQNFTFLRNKDSYI